MNPIEILYSWQAILVALVASSFTQLIKVSIDVWLGNRAPEPTPTVKDMAAVGKEKRQGTVVLNRIVLPAIAPTLGALAAVIIPARPDVIVTYVTAHEVGVTQYLIYAAWGAACGQFSDYTVSKVKAAVQAFATSGAARRGDEG